MASWGETRCICCGEELDAPLASLGALYCQDCRHGCDPSRHREPAADAPKTGPGR